MLEISGLILCVRRTYLKVKFAISCTKVNEGIIILLFIWLCRAYLVAWVYLSPDLSSHQSCRYEGTSFEAQGRFIPNGDFPNLTPKSGRIRRPARPISRSPVYTKSENSGFDDFSLLHFTLARARALCGGNMTQSGAFSCDDRPQR